jgi:hypothetical protein
MAVLVGEFDFVMSIATQISVIKDTATPEMQFLRANVTPHRMAAEIGPRATRLVQRNFLTKEKGGNKMGWPSTHFYARAAEATNWQEGFGFVMISVNQIGIRQRLEGGDIKPVKAGALTIPAVADAYGKRAREFNNLKFGFALDPVSGKMRPALVEAQATQIKIGKIKKSGQRTITEGTTSTGLVAIFWLLAGVHQDPDPTVLPTDEEFGQAMDQSIQALLRHPTQTN